jgi:hypothetical protein
LLSPAWTCATLPELPSGVSPFAELRVLVDERGQVAHVHVAAATNREVGDLAAQCALRQRYAARRNQQGRAVAAVLEITVRFDRRAPVPRVE